MRLEGGAKSDFRPRKSLWCLNEPLDLRKDESGGVFARWLVRLGSAGAPYSAFGTITTSSRIGWKLSKFPMTRTLKEILGRYRAVPGSARESFSALLRREESVPGAGAHATRTSSQKGL